MTIFKNKNIVITGASRGIGLSKAKKLATDGAVPNDIDWCNEDISIPLESNSWKSAKT